jgi:hypothetical protein
MAQALLPRYANAQMISFTDKRMTANYVTYDSPGDKSGKMRGYLVKPASDGPFSAVLVIHENRGLNPYIEDVARRAAVEGFVALAPDGLYPVGGYPGNDDDGKKLQRGLDRDKLQMDILKSAKYLKSHELSTGKIGASGFEWGGSEIRRREHPGTADDPVRRERPAHQRHAPRLRSRAQIGRQEARNVHLSRHQARFPQQLDAALQQVGHPARLRPHNGVLQSKPRVKPERFAPSDLFPAPDASVGGGF